MSTNPDQGSDALMPPTNSAPAARRSVSFGPPSVSPTISTIQLNGNATSSSDQSRQGESSTKGTLLDNAVQTQSGVSSRRVASGSSSTGNGGLEGSTLMTPSNSSSGSTVNPNNNVLKPALKAGTDRKRLPPPSQYQHSDPLLRRLRLVDDKGNPVNLKEFFNGVKVVAFYFSSQWAGQPLKEYHTTISEFAREHQREFKVIYVSVDVDEQWYKAGVKGQPWVSMVWNDGSSLPSPSTTNATSPSAGTDDDESFPPLYNDENFLLAQEFDIDESLSKTDTSGEAYLRPFSRVHLASKLNIIAAPTVSIYHVEKQKMLDWNVRMARLHRNQRDETWSRWKRGESAKSFGFSEALANSPGTVALTVFVALYWLTILIGGQKYNVLRRAVESLDPNTANNAATGIKPAAADTIEKVFDTAKEHLEF